MDSELFELCKEVYKRTDWVATRDWIREDGLLVDYNVWATSTPLYTSDYLLEKLLPHTSIHLLKRADGYIDIQYDAELPDYTDYSSSDIRITLLKLVIALDDAGVKL